MPIAEPDLIALRLTSYAIWYAASRGYVFGDGVERQHVPELARTTSARILGDLPKRVRSPGREIRALVLEASVRQGEGAFSSLVDAMILARPAAYGDDPARVGVIGEQTFHLGIKSLCPLWPIC